MPTGINADMQIGEFIGNIERLEVDFDVFQRRLQGEVDSAVRDVAEDFRDEVKDQIKKSDIDSDTGELMNSWVVRPKGVAHYQVTSTAEHAIYLELGTRPHTITGNGGWLKFIPDNPSPYPERNFTEHDDGSITGDYATDGLVVSEHDPLSDAETGTYFAKSVQHPGNESYGYFQDAVENNSWTQRLNNEIERRVSLLIEEFEASG